MIYDLVGSIRKRRLKWIGHILRIQNNRLVKLAVRVQHDMPRDGDIFADCPQHLDFDKLEAIDQDRKRWKLLQTSDSTSTSPRCRHHHQYNTRGITNNTDTTNTTNNNNNNNTTTTTTITDATTNIITDSNQQTWAEIFKPKAKRSRACKKKKNKP